MSRRSALIGLGVLLALRAALAAAHFRHSGGFPFFLSSAESLRAVLSRDWALAPRWNVDDMWLPGAFWFYGAVLRPWPDPALVLPVVNTLLTLGTLAGLFFLTELLTGSAALALGAAAYAAFQAESFVLGTGGSADPLLHLSLVTGLYCWVRSARGGGLPWMMAACAAIAAGCLVRYEAWLAAAGLAFYWIRDWPRVKGPAARLGPLIVLAAPVLGWLGYQSAHGETFRFLRTAVAAHDEDFERMGLWGRFVLGLGDFPSDPLLWLGRLVPAAAVCAALARKDPDGVRRRFLHLGVGLAAGFMLLGLFVEIHEDLHPWFLLYPAAPFVAWFVGRALAPLAPARRRPALVLAAGALAASACAGWAKLTRLPRPKSEVRRMAAALKACAPDADDGRILVQAFPETGPAPEHALQQGLALQLGFDRVLFDRTCDLAVPDPCSAQRPRAPSVLKLPFGELSSWLSARGVALVAGREADLPPAAGYAPVRFGSYAVLVPRKRRSLELCLASRGF